MKRHYIAIIGVLIFGILFNSCKKEDKEPSNSFRYDGTNYSLDKGYLENWGVNTNGSYDFDVYLGSSNIQYSASNEEFLGIGDVLYLDLNTSSANGLVNGTYNYSSDRNAFTFVDGVVGIDVDLSDVENEEFVEVVGGTIEVLVDGNTYTLEFDLTTESNTKITGRYKGTLTLI